MPEDFTVMGAMRSAASKRNDGFLYTLSGDLCQMSDQARFLQNNHFLVGYVDCYPALKTEEEFLNAIRLIYTYRINGWWNYRQRLIQTGVCTEEEFHEALRKCR